VTGDALPGIVIDLGEGGRRRAHDSGKPDRFRFESMAGMRVPTSAGDGFRAEFARRGACHVGGNPPLEA
jgi:hypothetical protein